MPENHVSPEPQDQRPAIISKLKVVWFSLWFVFVCVWFSDAGVDVIPMMILAYGILLWGAVWLIGLFVAVALWFSASRPRIDFRRACLRWSIDPAVIFLSGFLAFSGILCRVRFLLCRPAFDAYAAEVTAGRAEQHGFGTPRRRVGLFQVAETELHPDGVVRVITSGDFMDDAGFTFAPNHPPPVIGEDSYERISGNLYHWRRSW